MLAARIHEFSQPLQIDAVTVRVTGPDQELLNVAATGMARSGQGAINHSRLPATLTAVNDTLNALGGGGIVGRAVIVLD